MDWQSLLHNKLLLGGVAVAAAAGAFVLYKRKGNTAGTSDTTTTAAGTTGTPTLDTTGTDIASWLGQYSGSLQDQLSAGLAAYQNQLTDAVAGLQGMPGQTTTPTTTTTTPANPSIPSGETFRPGPSYVPVVKYTSSNTPWNSTLSGIAAHEHTSVSALLTLNPQITNPNVIRTGSQIRVS